MTIVFPGSFDPATYGHIDIAIRGAKLAERLIIAVLDNPNKRTLFTAEERVSILREVFKGSNKVEIDAFSGLLAEYVKLKNADAILRGLRTSGDFETESRYAAYNSMLSGGVETLFIAAGKQFQFVSSSIVREAAAHIYAGGLDDSVIGETVPTAALAALRDKYL